MDLTKQLAKAYTASGKQMALEMAAAVQAVVSAAAAGQGLPICAAWPIAAVPEGLLNITPKQYLDKADWFILVSEGIDEIPYLTGEPIWTATLSTDQRIILI